ncbi:MAG: single-stranded-DNA-specific exonuclease RecJ [Candidatus Zixiibacteriota bacterium]|nr:MAG: single-stranded-DNA-specific exonuclease RecJ [candidate division Zixibacteria bacterium]
METQKRSTQLKWELSPEPDPALVDHLGSGLSLPPMAVRILVGRGIDTRAKAEQFLAPSLDNLLDPFALPDMERGVDRVIRALRNKEKMMIFGDYDVDGITSTSLLFLTLNKLGGEVTYYLPNRLIEGYGLSEEGIQEAQRRGVKLIITVDCGITAVEEISFAQAKGIDTIVTDHHEPKEVLPDASAIINPKAIKGQYQGGELSGVGVAFKLAQAIYRRLGQDETELEEHLDLVALGTTADIVPLVGENRILTKFGMAQIARTNKPGLKSLIFVSGLLGQRIGTGQVVFILAPRINAVGRLGDADLAIKLLTTRDDSKAAEMARLLDEENQRRKNIDETTLREALEMIETDVNLSSDKAIVLASAGWHQGVIGIVASRLVERYHRPTVMIAIDGEEGKGSARSIRGFDLYEAIIECEEHLIRYGGHKYAAGLSISPEKIGPFRKKFKKVSDERLTAEDLIPKLVIDSELELDQVNPELLRILDLFAPFGPQNMRPVFFSRNLRVWGDPYVVGNNHLRMRVRKDGPVFDCIGFGMGDLAKILCMKGIRIDLAYVAETNVWNDTYKIQLRVKDLKICDHII